MGHIHISGFMTEADNNFTHRIHRLSFGDDSPGIIHPMEGDEKITTNRKLKLVSFVEDVVFWILKLYCSNTLIQYVVFIQEKGIGPQP